ncbi:MAG: DbpA RNA binding domain-containing protein [Spirochaetaceae bacterium]
MLDTSGAAVPPTFLLSPFLLAAKGSAAQVQGILLTHRLSDLSHLLEETPFETAVLGLAGTPRSERGAVNRDPTLIVTTPERLIDHIRRENVDVAKVHTVVIEETSEDPAGYYTDVQYILSKVKKHPRIILFTNDPAGVPGNVTALLRRPSSLRLFTEEENHMASNEYIENSAELKEQIKQILNDIHNEEDPLELNAYKRFYKKHVPIWRRAYFTAYLLKYFGGSGLNGGRRPSRRSRRHSDNDNTGSTSGNGEMTSVFIGIGKNRRVFPRDLVALFTEVEGISGDDIGQIKILDNYSFMEIKEDRAQTAIDAVNGREFRGRKLNVNYARKKD